MRDRVRDAKRVVIKLGSSLFFNESGNVALGRVFSFIEDIAEARLAGRQIIVVSSGAVALGSNALKMKSASAMLVQKQAFAAVGQSRVVTAIKEDCKRLIDLLGKLGNTVPNGFRRLSCKLLANHRTC